MHTTTKPRRLLHVFAAVVLLVGSGATVAGAEQSDDAADAVSESADRPSRPFLDVPGVDLAALGHEGPMIDGAVIDRMGEDLPSDPYERAVEISHRLTLAPPQLESLVAAEDVLAGVVSSLEADTTQAEGAVEVAARRVEAAGQRLSEAVARVEARVESLGHHRDEMAEVAVAAYVRPPDADVLAKVMGGVATTTSDLSAGVLFSAKADHDGEVRDTLQVLLAVGQEQRLAAEADSIDTGRRAEEASRRLQDLEQRRDAFRAAFAQIQPARVLLEEQIPALEQDLARTIQEAWGSLSDPSGMGPIGTVGLISVGGISVHRAVAPGLHALLEAAHADGVYLGGWGHRTVEQQIALRRAHCGPTPEDIYLKPAGACSPPTAQPGASMHERGLAIDFHLAGQAISTRHSPGFQWLAANAAQYGFHNLPSEPWHWSVNGQ